MSKMKARDLALLVLKEIEENEAYANLALDKFLQTKGKDMEKVERGLCTELVYGVMRRLNTLDFIVEEFMSRPLKKQTILMRNILRLAVYQIYYLDKIPQFAVVNEAANQARHYLNPGAVKFVNGVLRSLIRKKEDIVYPDKQKESAKYIALFYSHPLWLVEKWLGLYGYEETVALCEEGNKSDDFYSIRTNTLKINRTKLLDELSKEGVEAKPCLYAPEAIAVNSLSFLREKRAFLNGLFTVQEESSMLASLALSPFAGARVLDAAAAPGGKTTHLAQLMENKGEILAVDIHAHKLDLIRENCQRLGINCVKTFQGDASLLPCDFDNSFDFALVDAPCSGLGVLKRRPDARWRKENSKIKELVALQKKILGRVAKCLKSGGVLVYSTCTICPEENLEQIKAFLKDYPDFYLEELTSFLPASLDADKTLALGYLQLLPHKQGVDGFFIARCRKKEFL